MKIESSTFLCTVPHIRPASPTEDDSTSITQAEEENERLRARNKGWELLRPLEGNCMYFVDNPTCPLINYLAHRMVDLRILSQSLCKTIPRYICWKCSSAVPTRSRSQYRVVLLRANTRK